MGVTAMTDCKLVPVEPTDEMVLEGARHLRIMSLPAREAASVYQAMLAAAPAVQGEPVAYLFNDEAGRTKIVLGKETAELWCPPDESITPLYTAPQPAEQPCPEDIREGAPYDDPA